MGLRDLAVLVDHVRDALRVLGIRGVRGAVREADAAIGVAEEREVELELFGEGAILLDGVEADAEDLRVFGFVLRIEVPEPGTFTRSTGSVGFRIEPEHDFLSAESGKRHAVAVIVEHVEVRCGVSRLQHVRIVVG